MISRDGSDDWARGALWREITKNMPMAAGDKHADLMIIIALFFSTDYLTTGRDEQASFTVSA